VLAVGLLAWDLSEPWRTAPPSVAGQIALPVAGGVSLVDSTTGRTTELIPARQNASVTAVAWSPDRQTLAYTLFHRRAEDRVSSAELFTMPARGGEPTLVVPRLQPGTVIDAPAWAPDGQSIYFAFQGVENGQPIARVERVDLATGSRQQLFDDGMFPTVSADGKQLAFMHDDGSGQGLRIGPVTGGESRELVKATMFRGLMGPRFSPDGQWIAFVAVGPGPSGARPSQRPWLADLIGVRAAYAHGDPWGIWKIRPDGSELQRATPLEEDEPLISWSRDGAWLAVHGTGGLWIVDARGVGELRRIADGTIGGIDW
jgi:Tol biopolymer transport system component